MGFDALAAARVGVQNACALIYRDELLERRARSDAVRQAGPDMTAWPWDSFNSPPRKTLTAACVEVAFSHPRINIRGVVAMPNSYTFLTA